MTSKTYALMVLTAIMAVNHLDRHILGISLDAISEEFALTNTQLGLLSGLYFALVYVLVGFPIAKLAARGNCRNIVAVSAAVWSLFTIVTGAAQNFLHLVVARLGVGIGEAGGVAPSHSMISDLYPPEQRTSAMATFVVGANIGVLLAFVIGGVIGHTYGWRWAFVIAGIPGLLLALVLWQTVREPVREPQSAKGADDYSLFLTTLKTIWNDKGSFHAMWGIALTGIVTFGALAWYPTFIIRSHDLNPAQTGIFLALTIGIVGGAGTWLSGRLADRWGAKAPHWRIGVVIAAILLAKPFAFGFLLLEPRMLALASFVVAASMASVFWGPTVAYLHGRVDVEMRPMATAIFLFMFNLVGIGVGPTLVGIFSDTLFVSTGDDALRYALASIQFIGIWGAWHYWQTARGIASCTDQEKN